jgi:hypothetical protein
MRPLIVGLLPAAGLALVACETYKADARQGADETAAAAADESSGQTAPPPAAPAPPPKPSAAVGGGPSCDEVVAHLAAMTEKELATLGEEERAKAAEILPTVKAQIAQACASSDWSAEFKQCILAATSEDELRACEKFAPAAATPPAVAIPPDPKTKPAAAEGGGPPCAEVVDHVIEVALGDTSLPEAQREQMKAVLPQQKQLMLEVCDKTPWPAALRTCLLQAKNATELQGCRAVATPK